MKDRIYLLVRCTVKTTHKNIHDAIQELQEGTILQVASTPNVNVLKTEIIHLNTKSSK